MGSWSQAGQGAAGGALTGASIGSVVPGIGTAVGAIGGGLIGGIAGYFGDDGAAGYQDQLKALAAGYGSRTAPQAGPAAQGAYSSFRANQAGLISQLEAMARGQGPSAATMQMREAMDRAAGAQASAAAGAGGRGVNQGAALRNAADNTAALQAQNARDTGLMRVQEQLGATQMLGSNIAAGRQADESMNQFNAGQQNDMSRANLEAQLRMLGLNDEAQLKALLAAMGGAGPGLGSQLLAGGASSAGTFAQMAKNSNSSTNPYGGAAQTGPVTTPGGSSDFGQYSRPDNG